ncbi:hypothetical protein SDC9_202121 [bioreactor metagenome]|uniref:Uncharacterized protein n=1 Tax=bioreactor metagenome TaxID=1076179 RepID=A0A645ISU0_9ZZZZ
MTALSEFLKERRTNRRGRRERRGLGRIFIFNRIIKLAAGISVAGLVTTAVGSLAAGNGVRNVRSDRIPRHHPQRTKKAPY